jgi:hypothetical protein
MSTTNDTSRAALDGAAPAPARNGSLSDRVRSLRLSDKPAAGRGKAPRSAVVPWVLCGCCW